MMSPLHASLLGLALAYAGMAGLCCAMDRHYHQLTQRHTLPRAQRWLLRLAGSVLLAAAAWPCGLAFGASVGAVVWLGLLSTGALLLALVLPAAPRLAAYAAPLALLAAALLLR